MYIGYWAIPLICSYLIMKTAVALGANQDGDYRAIIFIASLFLVMVCWLIYFIALAA